METDEQSMPQLAHPSYKCKRGKTGSTSTLKRQDIKPRLLKPAQSGKAAGDNCGREKNEDQAAAGICALTHEAMRFDLLWDTLRLSFPQHAKAQRRRAMPSVFSGTCELWELFGTNTEHSRWHAPWLRFF